MADMTLTDGRRQVVELREERRHAESAWRIALRRFRQHRMAVFGVVLMSVIVCFVIVGAFFFSEHYANTTSILNRNKPPSAEHIMGTDQVGRDILARVIYGGQISLAIAIISVTISITLGTFIGLVAGYYSGWVDSVLMRIVEALLSIPTLILLLMLSSVLARMRTDPVLILGRELSPTVIGIILIIGLTTWMPLSRIVRSLVLSLKEQEFVLAAESIGARHGRIIFTHMLPNCLAPVVVSATLAVGNAIITEAYLSFLGFGVLPPTATWGNILTRAQENIDGLWWMWIFPGACIVLTVLAINFIGDGLRDAMDPRSTK